jgi:hypothetical protein
MSYTHHPAPTIQIPGRHAIRRRAMKMGEDGIEATKKMFEVRCNYFIDRAALISTLGTGL